MHYPKRYPAIVFGHPKRFLLPISLACLLASAAALSSASATTSADASVGPVSNTEWADMVSTGVWHPGCPVNQAQLRRVNVNFLGFDGAIHRGTLIVRADVAPSVARIFTRLFDAGFPIRKMVPIEAYQGDDNASMADDNTSAFNCRQLSQANSPVGSSPHANGRAIDINPAENPWVDPRCNCFRPNSKFATNRSGPGVITKGSLIWKAFHDEGWTWQDTAKPDYQHFDTGYPSRPLKASSTLIKTSLPFSVPVVVGNSTQIITVKASGSRAVLTAWAKEPSGWHVVLSTNAARIGLKGITDGATRKQNTYTTPSGTFALTQAFGILADPGTALPYHVVAKDDWWVEDNNSPYYNTMRTASQGGFDVKAPESDVNGSEHLITHIGQYNYVVVIDYNMNPPIPYRGAGIFLHVSNGHPTAGCIAIPTTTMVALLHWLDPSTNPRIAIG